MHWSVKIIAPQQPESVKRTASQQPDSVKRTASQQPDSVKRTASQQPESNGEAKLGPPIIMCTRSYPEYGEGCADGECAMDSTLKTATAATLRSSSAGQPSRLMGSASVISREEQFEDYGEGEDVDFTPSSPCPEEETRTTASPTWGPRFPPGWWSS
ncbi:hypothetical protein F7725_002883 [Dissostichus mawsoni]|uniref:Uncharacterized protein n=1 Tax=Dissostichus mawsoni TaxID=36200 RepID=A0A7J5Y8R0_DISMA|nr:hypothetical protein F7725_002883 [Dissostichus mawsoni]